MKTGIRSCALSAMSALLLTVVGCASTPQATPAAAGKPERNFNAPSLTVNLDSHFRQVLDAIPPESMMERFDTYDVQGRLISYVAFTDTETGALVFVDGKLHGSLSRQDAQAYYVCRGYTLVPPNRYWSSEASDWVNSLLAHARPVSSVELEFSGKSTVQSIREVAENPLIGKIRSFLGMGSNPLSVINTLNTARNDYEASELFDGEAKGMRLLQPGMSEMRLASIAKPQELAFSSGGMVMAYPTHRVEYFVADGVIRVIHQPSFHTLFRTRTALFYAPGAQWSLCNPKRWMEALPRAEIRETDSRGQDTIKEGEQTARPAQAAPAVPSAPYAPS